MTEHPQTGFVVRRIVVALDSSTHSRAALAAAAALAEWMEAEIEGLYVEDINLVNLAGLPFGNAVDVATGRAAPFDSSVLEAQMRAETARARRALEEAARQGRLRASFRVARGRLESEILAAAAEADLLIVGAAGLDVGLGLRFKPGRVALAAAAGSPGSVLLLRHGTSFRGRPLVPYDGTPASDKALDAAAGLARLAEAPVRLLITAPDPDKAAALYDRASNRLAAAGVEAARQEADDASLLGLCRIVHESDADIVVLPADDARLQGEGRATLLERVACPVLLVR